MRLSWGGKRARKESASPRTAREHGKRVQKDRAEILRLIARLRNTRARLEASGDPRGDQLKAQIQSTLNAQMSRLSDIEPPRVPRPGAASIARPGHGEPPRLGQSAGTPTPPGGGAVSVLQRLEERLERIEGRLAHPQAAASEATSPAADYTLSGAIQGDMLSDVLQMISSNSMTGIFTVDSDSTKYTIHFDDGQIIHADGGDLSGESAFFAAFAVTSGRYAFRETSEVGDSKTIGTDAQVLPAKTKTIDANTQFLILEALRRIDEDGSDEEQDDG